MVGIEVHCADEKRRFLPFGVVELRSDEIAIASSLTLLDESQLVFYRRRATTLRALRQDLVEIALQDVEIAEDGEIISLLLLGADGVKRAEAALLGSPASSWSARPT